MNQAAERMVRHHGGCHCGKVAFWVEAPANITAYECNCSICSCYGYLHLIVPKERFRLSSGQENLASYRFHTCVADHLFCKSCGVKSYYVPRSHPDGYSVNVRCLEKKNIRSIDIIPFDGNNWERNVDSIRN